MSCLYILEINSLSVASFAIFFSHSESCLFTLLILSFVVRKLLIMPYFFYYCFYFHYSGRWVIEDLAGIYVRVFCICFSLGVLVSGLTYRSLIILSLFVCMVLESGLFSFFYRWLTNFPARLVKEIVFSPLYIFATFVKDKVSLGA